LKITLVLPTAGIHPVGGYKVTYEYANHLAARGHSVKVIHSALYDTRASSFEVTKSWLRYLYRLGNRYGPQKWFKIDSAVKLLWVPSLNARFMPNADVVIATAWQTAEWIANYPKTKGKKLQIVYDYEHYKTASSELRQRITKAFKSDTAKIATSPSVVEMLLEATQKQPEYYVSNGIDLKTFQLDTPIDSNRKLVGFPSRPELFKGTKNAVEALATLHPWLEQKGYKVWSYGGHPPDYLPSWVEYYQRPSEQQLRYLHNQTAVFLVPSHYEGWGLPGAEAMACGAALVSTDNGGVRAYAQNQVTAILCPPQNIEVMAESVKMLLEDQDFRQKIAYSGYQHIQSFTWEGAVDELEKAIKVEMSKTT
jgi:glycosyltransferase involved in cell wall biosynthesis